jgi:ABC-type nitrate/sulfonate/bicarbonate transport system ATPase subunit
MGSEADNPPIVTLVARNVDARRCPFKNPLVRIELRAGDCIHLRGGTGIGKTTLSGALCGLTAPSRLQSLGITAEIRWRGDVPARERVGALFQTTTLLDSLSVGGNVAAALELSGRSAGADVAVDTKRLVEAVGLDWARDGNKMAGELSGGMARRASLALQLAQAKRVIVLDEPFTGLDADAGKAVAAELRSLRETRGTALLLVSHQPDLVALVHNAAHDAVVQLEPADRAESRVGGPPSLRGHTFACRLRTRLRDYTLLSLPLILLALGAAGLAVSALLADLLLRVDVHRAVDAVLEEQVAPLVKTLIGADAPPLQQMMTMMAVRAKARAMVDGLIPGARAVLYAAGVTKLFVLELGPLLTGLLLAGRIGGAYAGDVASMAASHQNKLLRTLGASPMRWTLAPAAVAALLAAPLLSAAGTALALALAAAVGDWYGLDPALAASAKAVGSTPAALALGGGLDGWFWSRVRAALLPPLRLRCASAPLACARAALVADAIELVTWPLIHHVAKSASFVALALLAAELSARWDADMPTRAVPRAITNAVVGAGVAVIVADWGWSRVLIQREGELVL